MHIHTYAETTVQTNLAKRIDNAHGREINPGWKSRSQLSVMIHDRSKSWPDVFRNPVQSDINHPERVTTNTDDIFPDEDT